MWYFKRFYEGLHKTLWGTTKKCEHENWDVKGYNVNSLQCSIIFYFGVKFYPGSLEKLFAELSKLFKLSIEHISYYFSRSTLLPYGNQVIDLDFKRFYWFLYHVKIGHYSINIYCILYIRVFDHDLEKLFITLRKFLFRKIAHQRGI